MVALEAPSLPRPEFKTSRKSGSAADREQRGSDLYRKGDIAGALAEYNAALDVAPDNLYLRRTRALLLGELGRYEEAIADFDHLLETQPRSADLHLLKGMALYKVGRYEESLKECEEGSHISPGDPNLHAMCGYALDALGQQREALAAFDRSLMLQDNSHVAEAKRAILDSLLRMLVERGLAAWSGKRAQGSKNPVPITPGPPVSDYVIQDRR